MSIFEKFFSATPKQKAEREDTPVLEQAEITEDIKVALATLKVHTARGFSRPDSMDRKNMEEARQKIVDFINNPEVDDRVRKLVREKYEQSHTIKSFIEEKL